MFAKSIITELERIASTDAEEPRKESKRRWKRKRFIKWLHLWRDSCNDVRNFLTELAIDSAPRRCILYQRYVQKKKWAEILPMVHEVQKQWRQDPMSERQMYVEHLKALEDAAEWVNKTGKYMYIGRI